MSRREKYKYFGKRGKSEDESESGSGSGSGMNNNNNISERERQALEEIVRLDKKFKEWEMEEAENITKFTSENKERGVTTLSIVHGIIKSGVKKIVIFSRYHGSVLFYDEERNVIEDPNIHVNLHGFDTVDYPDGSVYLIGGDKTFHKFDGQKARTLIQTHMEWPRDNPNAVLLQNGIIFVVGGSNVFGVCYDGYFFNPKNNDEELESSKSDMIYFSYYAAMSVFGESKAILCGGRKKKEILKEKYVMSDEELEASNEEYTLNKSQIYDWKTDSFTAGPEMKKKRFGHTATLLKNGSVLVCGGDVHGGRSTEIYNPSENRFVEGPNMLYRRSFHTAKLLSDGRVLICYGGNITEIYDPKTRTFSVGPELP